MTHLQCPSWQVLHWSTFPPKPSYQDLPAYPSPSNIWANSTNIFGVNTCGFRFLALGEVALLLGKHVGESVQGLGELRHSCRIEVWCLVMEGLLIHNSNFKQKNGQVARSTTYSSSCENPGSNILPIIFIGRHRILRILSLDLAQVLQVSHAMVQLKQPRKLRLPGNAMLGLDALQSDFTDWDLNIWDLGLGLPNHWILFRMVPNPFLNKSQLLKDLQGRFYQQFMLIAGLWQWKREIAKPQKGAQLDHQHQHKVTPLTATTFHHHPSCITCRPATFQRPTADKFGATSSVPLSTTLATTSPHDTWMRRQRGCSLLKSLHILGKPTKHFEIKVTYLATYWQAPHHIHAFRS